MCGKKLVRDIITDPSIPLYAKLPSVDDVKMDRELVIGVKQFNDQFAQGNLNQNRTMKRVLKQNPFCAAIELDSQWLPVFLNLVSKVALPELILISIWGTL